MGTPCHDSTPRGLRMNVSGRLLGDVPAEEAGPRQPLRDDVAEAAGRLARLLDAAFVPDRHLGPGLVDFLPDQQRPRRLEHFGGVRQHFGWQRRRLIWIGASPRRELRQLHPAPVLVGADEADEDGHHAHEERDRDELQRLQPRRRRRLDDSAPRATWTATPTEPVVSAPRHPQRRVAATSTKRNHASTGMAGPPSSQTYAA